MKKEIIIAAALLLSGCETDEDFWRPYHYVTMELGRSPRQNRRQLYSDPQCAQTAQQHADDAMANSADDETVEAIYDDTYANCANWKKQHAL